MRASDSRMTVSCVYCRDFSKRRVVSDKRGKEKKEKEKKGIINSSTEETSVELSRIALRYF